VFPVIEPSNYWLCWGKNPDPASATSVTDPGSGAFLTLDPGKLGSGIRDEQSGSSFLELRNLFFWVKILRFFMRIRDPGWEKFGSGIEKNIPDP
jgi:hypothetical protein